MKGFWGVVAKHDAPFVCIVLVEVSLPSVSAPYGIIIKTTITKIAI